jgi:acyl-[acyl-carrier-protein]-phospholipid O-acyltransferase/long-chain-fatty-acid--[acyl-carrier-protein] ligase
MVPVKLAIPEDIDDRKRRLHGGAALHTAMRELVLDTPGKAGTIIQEMINSAKEFGEDKLIIEDPVDGAISYRKLLIGVRVLGAKFSAKFADRHIGVMLPNSNGAAIATLGLMSAGKIPSMINFTAGVANIKIACEVAGLRTVLTSKEFIKRAKLDDLIVDMSKFVEVLYLEGVRGEISRFDKIKGLLLRRRPVRPAKVGDHAIILYTSGSEGVPKGVILTHHNILANATQSASRIEFNSSDKVFNVLPVFHAFGLTAGTLLPLLYGVPVFMFPKATDFKKVPEAIHSSNATILFGTDAFLNGYARAADTDELQSIRYIFAGAAKVEEGTRTLYLDKFGKHILEGYGVTEGAPVIALNTPMANKVGSVGRLLPGIEARFEAEPGMGDRLFVRGANVMAGYLRVENPGVIEPPVDGWHDTGDIVKVDKDGFITIIDRAKSFAKIGGEMVSTTAVTNVVTKLWPGHVSAAVNVPSPRKGEKIVLVTENEKATKSDLIPFFKEHGMSELSIPSEIIVAKIPVLASGKVDIVALKKSIREGSLNEVR